MVHTWHNASRTGTSCEEKRTYGPSLMARAPARVPALHSLYTYLWSCDRDLERRHQEAIKNGMASTAAATIHRLRRLAAYRPTAARTVLLYGRSDARRRRLINVTAHLSALRALLPRSMGQSLVLWDDLWRRRRPLSVHHQVQVIRNTRMVVTLHGAWPSVWAFFLPEGSTVIEIFSACVLESWLPPSLLAMLRVHHVVLNRRSLGVSHQLFDSRTGAKANGCRQWPWDPDVAIPPHELASLVARLLRHQ